MQTIEFTVIGTPAPQGSKRFLGVKGGKGIMIESSTKVKPWRQAVQWAAMNRQGYDGGCIIGPVVLEITFSLPRPKKYAKQPLARPTGRPDSSKLLRSTEDAITDVGLWEDDSRVVDTIIHKHFAGHPDAMAVPGAKITIRSAA